MIIDILFYYQEGKKPEFYRIGIVQLVWRIHLWRGMKFNPKTIKLIKFN